MNQPIPTAQAFVFDSSKLKQFLYQVACTRILAKTTRACWSSHDSSVILNTVYNVFNRVRPGFVEVETLSPYRLRREIDEYYPRLWKEFTLRATQGPAPMKDWLDRQQTLYTADRRDLQKLFLQARQVNQQVDEQLRVAIFRLAEVKMVSEIALNILSLFPGGGAVGLAVRLAIGVGYPIFVNAVDNWGQAGAAQMTLSVAAGSSAQYLPPLGTEDAVVKKAQVYLVDKPAMEAARARALGKLPRGWKGAAVKRATMAKECDAAMARVGIKAGTTVLQGVACWYCYQGCQDSANRFWETVNQ